MRDLLELFQESYQWLRDETPRAYLIGDLFHNIHRRGKRLARVLEEYETLDKYSSFRATWRYPLERTYKKMTWNKDKVQGDLDSLAASFYELGRNMKTLTSILEQKAREKKAMVGIRMAERAIEDNGRAMVAIRMAKRAIEDADGAMVGIRMAERVIEDTDRAMVGIRKAERAIEDTGRLMVAIRMAKRDIEDTDGAMVGISMAERVIGDNGRAMVGIRIAKRAIENTDRAMVGIRIAKRVIEDTGRAIRMAKRAIEDTGSAMVENTVAREEDLEWPILRPHSQ
jgi:hypothetical protein